jgi:hypothetical protein
MRKLVHTREISMRTFDLGDHLILVEGNLVDHRYRPGGKKTPASPQPVHDMVIRLKVRGPAMRIEEAEAGMPYHPREDCPDVLPSIRNLNGLEIAPGYTRKVKRLVGGVRGCAHLTSLVIAMGESAVQGYWAAYEAERGKRPLNEQTIRKFINTCHLWKEDGPILKKLLEKPKSASG